MTSDKVLAALADEHALLVFGAIIAATGTGVPQRRWPNTLSYTAIPAAVICRKAELERRDVNRALRKLAAANMVLRDARSRPTVWRTNFPALRALAA